MYHHFLDLERAKWERGLILRAARYREQRRFKITIEKSYAMYLELFTAKRQIETFIRVMRPDAHVVEWTPWYKR
jgi:hypothetical protein